MVLAAVDADTAAVKKTSISNSEVAPLPSQALKELDRRNSPMLEPSVPVQRPVGDAVVDAQSKDKNVRGSAGRTPPLAPPQKSVLGPAGAPAFKSLFGGGATPKDTGGLGTQKDLNARKSGLLMSVPNHADRMSRCSSRLSQGAYSDISEDRLELAIKEFEEP